MNTHNEIDAVRFQCPYCEGKAYAYSVSFAGCNRCGVLLYTDIQPEVSRLLRRKAFTTVAQPYATFKELLDNVHTG